MTSAPELRRSRLPIQIDVLRHAVEHVLAHHAGLRAAIEQSDGRWVQEIQDVERAIAFAPVTCDDPRSTRELWGRWARVAEEALDPRRGKNMVVSPILDGASGECHRLAILCGHLVTDHLSGGIVSRDLRSAYLALSRGEPPALQPSSDVREYAERVEAATARGAWDADLPHWDELLAEASRLPRFQRVDGAGAPRERYVSVLIPPATTSAIARVAGVAARVSPALVGWTAVLQAVADETGREGLLAYVMRPGRARDALLDCDLSNCVCALVTACPVLVHLRRGAKLLDAIVSLQGRLAATARATGGLGFWALLQNRRRELGACSADTMTAVREGIVLNWAPTAVSSVKMPTEPWGGILAPGGTLIEQHWHTPLMINGVSGSSGWKLEVRHRVDLLPIGLVDTIMSRARAHLDAVA